MQSAARTRPRSAAPAEPGAHFPSNLAAKDSPAASIRHSRDKNLETAGAAFPRVNQAAPEPSRCSRPDEVARARLVKIWRCDRADFETASLRNLTGPTIRSRLAVLSRDAGSWAASRR